VVVIEDECPYVGGSAVKVTGKWGSLSVDTESLFKFDAGVTWWWLMVLYAGNGVVDITVVLVVIGIFATNVVDDVPMMEIECDLKHAESQAMLVEQEDGIAGVVPWQAEGAECHDG
jgi:hypothetical protein